MLDSDFHRVLNEFASTPDKLSAAWNGATVLDITSRDDLDMKPRRLVPRALENIRKIKNQGEIELSGIAEVLETKIDLLDDVGPSEFRRVVEGQNIRAIEGIVVPHFAERCWAIAERKQRKVYQLRTHDLIVGLVRPERRNVGILLEKGDDVVGSPDGLAVVRVLPKLENEYPIEWLFAVLRSEQIRLQFWTESGGTSYGKLDTEQIRNVLIPVGSNKERKAIASKVSAWLKSAKQYSKAWSQIGIEGDQRPILNSPLTGLFDDDDSYEIGVEADIFSEDEWDAKMARRHLTEIRNGPVRLIQGKELDDRLTDT